MVNWDNYKSDIVALTEEGMSSREVANILSKTNAEVKPTHDRSIRNALQRWREDDDLVIDKKPAKVLLFDIEVSPFLVYQWSLRQKYTKPEYLKEDQYVICWSAKWLFEDGIISSCVTPEESKRKDDKRIVKELWDLLDEADITISHNGDNFDVKKMNGRFSKCGLNLPSPYQNIDTYKAARKRLSVASLSLDYLARHFGIKGKDDTDFQLWLDCMDGDKGALNKMQMYCDQDIRVLEDVYLKLRPFITSHPNLGLFIKTDTKSCPACGSEDIKETGTYTTTVNMYKAYRCQDCGSLTRDRHSSVSTEDKKNLTRSTAR